MLDKTIKKSKILLLVITIFATLVLADCCGNPEPPRPVPPEDPAVVLERAGVQIIVTGETYRIVIPSEKLFYPDSSNFLPDADPDILIPLADYLREFETTTLKVAGYTDNSGFPLRNKVLSQKQAQELVAYLSEEDLDARIIYAVGYGQAFPIADNLNPDGRAENRRVEVRFREVIVPPV